MACNLHKKDTNKNDVTWNKKSYIKRCRAIEKLEDEYKFLRQAAGNWAANWIFKTYSENQNASNRRTNREVKLKDFTPPTSECQIPSRPKQVPSHYNNANSSSSTSGRPLNTSTSRSHHHTVNNRNNDIRSLVYESDHDLGAHLFERSSPLHIDDDYAGSTSSGRSSRVGSEDRDAMSGVGSVDMETDDLPPNSQPSAYQKYGNNFTLAEDTQAIARTKQAAYYADNDLNNPHHGCTMLSHS
jgi:hypothetical protein